MSCATLCSPEFLTLAVLAFTGAVLLCRRIGKLGLGNGPRLLSWGLVLGLLLFAGWTMERAQDEARERTRAMLQGFAPTYARELESLGHARLSLRAPPDDPLYLRLIEAEKRWLDSNPTAADIYTFRRLEDGTLVLAVDSETDYDHDGVIAGERESRTPIGEVYPSTEEAIDEAFEGRSSFSHGLEEDRWGTWLSAFEPLHDESGRVEAVLGVDFPAGSWQESLVRARRSRLGWLSALLLVMQSSLFVTAVLLPHLRERRRVERDLVRAREEAEEASRVKSLFLATMSHELRTPLNGIIGMGELLTDTPLDAEQREMLHVMSSSGRTLLALIEDVLDFSRIEAGKLELELTSVDLATQAEELVALFEPTAEAKGIDLVLDLDPRLPARMRCDGTRMRQVLTNLLSNAVKFTSHGEVVLRLEAAATVDGHARLVCSITDSGIGIPAASLGRLFKPFTQIDASLTRRFGGTGLGLSIVKQIVEKMGGTIDVRSVEGQGTTFTVHLAFAVPEETSRQALLPCHVVIVTPSDSLGASLRRLPESRLAHADFVRDADGIEAALRATPAGWRRVVLVDARVTGGPGALAERLLELGVEPAELVLLGRTRAIGALAPAERRHFTRELRHPVSRATLVELLENARRAAPELAPALPVPTPEAPAVPASGGRRALVVDDHPTNRKFLVRILETRGWACTAVSGGALAVEAMRAGTHDAVLMDMAMPDVDGLEAGKRIRALESARGGPRTLLLAVTALGDQNLGQRCLDIGFDDWLEKPIDPEVLFAALARTRSAS